MVTKISLEQIVDQAHSLSSTEVVLEPTDPFLLIARAINWVSEKEIPDSQSEQLRLTNLLYLFLQLDSSEKNHAILEEKKLLIFNLLLYLVALAIENKETLEAACADVRKRLMSKDLGFDQADTIVRIELEADRSYKPSSQIFLAVSPQELH